MSSVHNSFTSVGVEFDNGTKIAVVLFYHFVTCEEKREKVSDILFSDRIVEKKEKKPNRNSKQIYSI